MHTQGSGRERGYSGDTTPLLKAQQAECSQCWKWWGWDVQDPQEGAFPFPHAILREADGAGTLCHLLVRNPQRTREVTGLTLYPSPLSLCQQNFPATPSFSTCTVLNPSTPVSRAPPACGLKESFNFRYGWFSFPSLLLEHTLRQLFPLEITLNLGIVEIHRRWSSCKPGVEVLTTKQRLSEKKPR